MAASLVRPRNWSLVAAPAHPAKHPTSVQTAVSTGWVDDADLVDRARTGDSSAFGELMDRHRLGVYRAALAVLRSHADAEDAAQDAFIAAYRHLARFRGDSAFRTWLLAIAWRKAITRRRHMTSIWRRMNGRRSALGSADQEMTEVASADRTLERLADDHELRRHIRHAIVALTPVLRDTLLLTQSGDYTYEEISAIVGAPVGTIKWRVSEARRLVRRQLRAQGYADVG